MTMDFIEPEDFNFKFIPTTIKFNIFRINFKYKTVRGNSADSYRYIVAHEDFDARISFFNYMEQYNEKNSHRAMSNVKILDIFFMGSATQEIN